VSAADAQAEPTGAKTTIGRAPWSIWVLTAAFVALCATWSLLTPQFLAPDESAHFASSVRVSQGFSWPDPGTARFPAAVEAAQAEARTPHDQRSTLESLLADHPGEGQRFDQMTQHPPLYYLLTGGILALPGIDRLSWDIGMLSARLLGAVLAAPLIWLAWNGIGSLLRSRKAGVLAAVAVFAVPQLPQTMGVVTNDSLAILSAWVVVWLSIRVLKGDRRLRTIVALGIAFGVGCLTKGTVLPLGILLVLAPLLGVPSEPTTRRWRNVVLALGTAFVVGGWWWLRNIVIFRALQPRGLVEERVAPDPGSLSIGYYIDEVWNTTPTTFWGWFGRVNVPLPEPVIDVVTIACLLLVAVGAFRIRQSLPYAITLAAPVLLTVIFFVNTSWSAYAASGAVRGLHGRYFFTVLLALIALSALSVANITRTRPARRALTIVVTVGSVGMTFGGLGVAFLGLYADDRYRQWREGLSAWLNDYSPLPTALTLAVPATFAALLAIGLILSARDVRRGATAQVNPDQFTPTTA
jgi:4-amino-4-deoxy-L-arabinose transferase-like glycosyltransferase